MSGTYNSDSDDIAISTFAEKRYVAHTLNENDLKVSLKGYNVYNTGSLEGILWKP
jgi:hypothetical protein